MSSPTTVFPKSNLSVLALELVAETSWGIEYVLAARGWGQDVERSNRERVMTSEGTTAPSSAQYNTLQVPCCS